MTISHSVDPSSFPHLPLNPSRFGTTSSPSSRFCIQPKINAFALPSKDIFVYAGLVDLVDDDTLLAAVLAHEIAHVTQRHAVENVSP